jgi:hypothetical protein
MLGKAAGRGQVFPSALSPDFFEECPQSAQMEKQTLSGPEAQVTSDGHLPPYALTATECLPCAGVAGTRGS